MIPLVFLTSCNNSEEPQKEQLDFVVMGNVLNGEGTTLTLTIPSKYPNYQLFSKVVDGKFRFQGSISSPERAILSIAEEESFPSYIFLSQDSIKLDLEIGRRWGLKGFVSDSLLESDLNRFFRNSNRKFNVATATTVFPDEIQRDSMRKNVYPGVRKQLFTFYDQQFTKPEHSVVALYFLRTLLDYQDHVFYTEDLSETEKQKLNEYFRQLDPVLKNTPEYEKVALFLKELNNPSLKTEFVDYTLVNAKGEEVKLSEVVAKNRYTVLDFWYSGCGPCRTFNQEGKGQYAKLKEKQIEIIGINSDRKRSLWKKASEQDQIE